LAEPGHEPATRDAPGPPGRPGGAPRAWAAAAAGALILGAFAYSNSLRGDFVFDDLRQIRDNPVLQDLSNFVPGRPGFETMRNRYVAYLSFALNRRLFGPGPAGFHGVNLVIHLANALLVLALVALAFRTPRLRSSPLAPHAAAIGFAAASLFATHPLGTQAVTYVVQRLTSLATLFYLLSVVLYVAWRLGRAYGAPRRTRDLLAYAALLAAALLAVRTKEIAATLPLALALAEACLFPASGWRRFAPIAPVLALTLLIPLSLLDLGRPAAEVLSEANALTRVQATLGRLDYARTQVVVVADYLRLLALPIGQNVDHDVPAFATLLAPRPALSLAALAALAGLAAVLAWRTRAAGPPGVDPAARLVSLGIGWFFVSLLVESSLIPIVDAMNEHRAYLPSAGLLVAAATGVAMALRRASPARAGRLTVLASVLVSLLLAAATLRRNTVWESEVALWSDAAAKSPSKFRPWFNLGTTLVRAGEVRAAAGALQRAVDLDPASAPARAQLGGAWLQLGRLGDAEVQLREALRLQPDDPEALFNLATVLARTARVGEAREAYRRFLDLAPPEYAQARRVASAYIAR
jgi:tetratricopeptide (TPR) repeat protein